MQPVIPDGCQLIARQIYDSDIWINKPAWWLKVWIYLILEVNHTDNKHFKRGTNFFDYKEIKEDCHIPLIDPRSIHHVIRYLREAGMIVTQKTTRGIIITIVKYDHFQNLDNYKSASKSDTGSDTESASSVTQKCHGSDTINNNVIIKECNNIKNTPNPNCVAMANLLKSLILTNNPKAVIKESQITKWADVVRLMTEVDKIALADIESAIRKSQADINESGGRWKGWGKVILSMANVRQHYNKLISIQEGVNSYGKVIGEARPIAGKYSSL